MEISNKIDLFSRKPPGLITRLSISYLYSCSLHGIALEESYKSLAAPFNFISSHVIYLNYVRGAVEFFSRLGLQNRAFWTCRWSIAEQSLSEFSVFKLNWCDVEMKVYISNSLINIMGWVMTNFIVFYFVVIDLNFICILQL